MLLRRSLVLGFAVASAACSSSSGPAADLIGDSGAGRASGHSTGSRASGTGSGASSDASGSGSGGSSDASGLSSQSGSGPGHGHGGGAGADAGGTIVCAGYSTLTVDMSWDDPSGPYSVAYTSMLGGFEKAGALVVRFTTPAVTSPPTSGKGNMGTVEFQGPPAGRTGSLSTTPCDFSVGITSQAGLASTFATDEPTLYFTLGYEESGYLELAPSTTYYWNELNELGGVNSCSPGPTCDVKVTLTKQPGT